MADDTVLNLGSGGDTVRDVAKTATSAKTQVMLADIGGGADSSPEFIDGPLSAYLAWGGTTNAIFTNSIVFPKASPGLFRGGIFYNPNSSIVYIQVLNLATGGTLGTTVPIHVIALAPNAIWNEPLRNLFASSGIAVAATTTPTGSTAPPTGISGEVFYL
ncbi:MAG TPA: hypothetical protein VN641_09985 [Urbifossiella sp.]|nr:hypothetical protein [Urbifossiella sp.]